MPVNAGGSVSPMFKVIDHALRTIANPAHTSQQQLLDRVGEEAVLKAPCIAVIGLMEAPGIVFATQDAVVVRNCMDKEVTVPFRRITAVQQAGFFNGRRRVWFFQHGFWVEGLPETRVGFAVSDAGPWRELFERLGVLSGWV